MTVSHGTYRTDIDGLRAIAVLPVVLYHYGVAGFSGGFVGVDIFFVISGFLIGGLLWSELGKTGRIALGAFFARRIRRLAPAYFVMALVTLIGAWFILLPFDFREFGQDLIAATVYLANVHFYRGAGYFDTASDLKLLLHTWSLSVEEQFYVVLPLLMLLFAARRRWLPGVLVALGLLSLVACLVMMSYDATASFYLFPFRAWELMAGVLLAIWGRERGFDWRIHAGLSWLGLALIALAVFTFSAGAHFPGAYAMVPVAGAVLIILNGQDDNLVNRALAHPVTLFFGLISYSLYLWHWPMVTLWKYYLGGEGLSPAQIALLFGISVAVAWLSYRFIETPFRRGALPGWRLPTLYGGASAAVIAGALSFAFSDGWPGRFPAQAAPYITASRDFMQDASGCGRAETGPWAGLEICILGPEGPPEVLVWGDSHAGAFKPGVAQAAWEAGRPGVLIWRGGCPPLVGVTKTEKVSSALEEAACARATEQIRAGLEATPSLDTVLMIGRWSYYADGVGIGQDAHNWITLQRPGAEAPAPDQAALFSTALQETVSALGAGQRRVYLLQQVPEIFDYDARLAAQNIAYGRADPAQIATTMTRTAIEDVRERFERAEAALARAARDQGARLLDLGPRLCQEGYCSALLEGQPIYFDNNHLTRTGVIALSDVFAPVFDMR